MADVEIAVSSVRQLDELLDAVRRTGRTATVTVKVDTGLNRNGVAPAQYTSTLTALRQAVAEEAIRLRGLMSHMVYADQPDNPINDVQAQRFTEMLGQARDRGVRFDVAHLSNSSATMSRPELAYDLVRPGIAVYGLSPVPTLGEMGLVPAMTVKCTVALVKSIRAGEGVSYGHTWIAQQDTTVALMPIGYADGVFPARRGVEDRDVGAVHRGPARIDVPSVRADRQIGHAMRHRVRRDDPVGVHVEGQNRVIRRRHGAEVGTALRGVRHGDSERFVDVDHR